MKTLLYLLFILGIGLFSSASASAQIGGEGRMGNGGSYWILGLNAGGAWQDSDVKARAGGGWGFYIGHSIYNKPESFFSVDARFRYMNTYTYGQNHKDNIFGNANLADTLQFNYRPDTANFAHNFETNFHDLSLELRLNFEKLRRTTNIWLSIYGGIGLGIYGTKFDQLDQNGKEYRYEDIDYTQSDDAICDQLITLRDDEYETNAHSDKFGDNLFQLTATPSVGIELGYWFTPNFALGIGHRVTFTLQDDFEGVKIKNQSSIHHYTSLMLHWRITGKKKEVPCPEVKFQLPVGNSQTYNTTDPNVFVKATVSNVTQNQITYTVNGQTSSNFSYNESDDVFQSNLQLREGENTVVVQANNKCGTDGQNVTIIYTPNKEPDPVQPPIVTITNPGSSPTTVKTSTVNITANIQYVTGRNNVVFTVNGQTNHNFSFTGTNFQASNVVLVSGQNTITVQGINKDGSDSKTVIINYEKDEPKLFPIVNITSPSNNPHTVSTSTVNLVASILNVATKNDVTFTVNGQASSNFSFSGTAFNANNIALNQGNNTLTVTGRNANGTDSKSIVIIYKPKANPPVVTITNPNSNPYNTNIQTATINATILNVTSAANVTYTVNGQASSNFNFSGTSFTANLNLVQGSNTITITGTNEAGQDSKTTVIVYQTVPKPPVVTITNPNNNPFTTNIATATINATILNVVGKSNVTYTVNGQASSNFLFGGTNFAGTANLQVGNNTITITGRNNDGQDSKTTVIIYRPQVVEQPPLVTITSPNVNPYTTQNAIENVTAVINNVSSRNNVTCTVNGQNNNSFAFSGTSFTLSNLALQPGNNTISITGRNNAGQDTKSVLIIYNQVVLLPPVVTITAPRANPYTTSSATETISATVDHVTSKSNVTCTVNGQNNNSFSFSGNSFTLANLVLVQGNNTITITGRNNAGQDTKSTLIIYQPVVNTPRPVVTITNPNVNPYTTQNQTVNIAATILNVDSRNDVTFKVNGMPANNFAFAGTSFTVSNLGLRTGNNTITISGRNSAGQDTKSTIIIYNLPDVPEPSVVITSPNQNPFTTTTSTVNIVAVIQNVATKSDVTFTINGQANTNFYFTGTSFTANNLNLNPGNNTFVITGRNASGQATASTVVIYNNVRPPVVTFTVPNQNPFNTQTATTNIAATISNVSNPSDVTLTVNGQVNNSFSFSNNVLTLNNINLVVGSNTFTVTGRNSAGQDTKTTVIIYSQPVLEPSVQITLPNQNPWSSATDKATINAVIQNVATKNDVTFTVNGQANNAFTFSGTAFSISNVQLAEGNNTFTITGRNSAGQASASTVIIYRPRAAEPAPIVKITSPTANPYSTQTATVNISADIKHVASKNDVTFVVNGQATTNFSFSGTNFLANNINLNVGNNTFTITGRNNVGQSTKSTIVIYSQPVQPPVVTITSPAQNPFTTTTASVNLAATILNVTNRNDVTFTVNGQPNTGFTLNGTAFAMNNIALSAGNTTFTITGRNSAGQDTKSTIVIFSKPVNPPVVTITGPNQNPFTTTNNTVNIQATILNVPSKNNVSFTVNGQNNTAFAFNGNNFSINNVPLNVGNNTFTITGSNSSGQDTKSTIVIYNQPVPEPTVVITSPSTNPFTASTNTVNLTATILNVPSRNNVVFTVNGQPNTTFGYAGTNFTANNLVLNPGNNTFVITGSNASGQATASTIVVYNPVIPMPQVTITSPTTNPYTSPSVRGTVTATITNVNSKNDVQLIVNNNPVNSSTFSFVGTNFTLTNYSLSAGSNIFTIIGMNGPNSDTATTEIIFGSNPNTGNQNGNNTALEPIITFTNPSVNPFQSPTDKINISAEILNVATKNDVTLKINGVVNNNFTFTNNILNISNVQLNGGNNTIEITGVKLLQTRTKSTVITYTPGQGKTVNPQNGANGGAKVGKGEGGGTAKPGTKPGETRPGESKPGAAPSESKPKEGQPEESKPGGGK